LPDDGVGDLPDLGKGDHDRSIPLQGEMCHPWHWICRRDVIALSGTFFERTILMTQALDLRAE
jgi:hypothetical protein